jgi:hypothetical protein
MSRTTISRDDEDFMSTQPSQINPTETPIESGHKLEDLLDIPRAAKLLGISPKTLRDHVLHRRIDYVKIGGRVLSARIGFGTSLSATPSMPFSSVVD